MRDAPAPSRRACRLPWGALALLSVAAQAATYNLPAALGSGPFANCSGAGSVYSCSGSIDFGSDNSVVINVSSAMTLTIAESLTAKNNFSVVQSPAAPPVLLSIVATNGSVDIKNNLTVTANITAEKGTINLGNNGTLTGNLIAQTINAGSGTVVNGVCTPSHPACNGTVSGPNHIRIYLNNNTSALTCAPRAVDAIACADVGCATPYALPVAVALSPGGTAATIPAGGTGAPTIAQTATGRAAITLASSVPATSGAPSLRCYSGTVGAPGAEVACQVDFVAAGFFVSVPNHRSCDVPLLTVTAAKTDDQTRKCVPAFDGGVVRTIKLRFGYADPGSGALVVPLVPTVGSANPPNTALATGSDAALAMTFNAGVATTNFQYQDAGSLTVSASYDGSAATGDAGLTMSTVSSPAFIVAPASFELSGIPTPPLTAGLAFNATVTAMNGCATPAATKNFGREAMAVDVTIASLHPDPGLGNATAIDVSLAAGGTGTIFTNGAASTDLTWNEVGKIDLKADLASYLGASLAPAVTGSLAGVGPFKPAYFDTVVTPGCGAFTYAGLTGTPALAGQPFKVEVKAKRHGGNSGNNTNTANYAGATWAKAVTLSKADASIAGTLANTSRAATDFSAGIASRADVSYGFASKLEGPVTLTVRAAEDITGGVTSSGHAEGTTEVRSGRLRLSNAFGSKGAALAMKVQALFWSGKTWVTNNADNCTSLAKNAFPLSGELKGSTTAAPDPVTLSSGTVDLMLTAAASGSVDVEANLGATGSGNDQSCLTANEPSTPANLPWLRARNGSCATTDDRDPSAKATFGIYSPETRKSIHVRELF